MTAQSNDSTEHWQHKSNGSTEHWQHKSNDSINSSTIKQCLN